MGFQPPDWTGTKLASIDGKVLTLGCLILIVASVWVWATFLKK
jgi:hypothetical protein